MSDHDQAAGLRQWANLRNGQTRASASPPAPSASGDAEHRDNAQVADASVTNAQDANAHVAGAQVTKTPLAVVGLGSKNPAPVIARLDEWARLGRRWAGSPQSWDIVPVEAGASLGPLCARYARWALWVRSDADAFAAMYRTLRLVAEHRGPRRLLALHEPGLPREGLLDNLQKAATNYLNIELLILAR